MRNIRQNLFFAFIYNAARVPLAAGVLYPALGILLSPVIAAAAMALSSVSVIANSLRPRAARFATATDDLLRAGSLSQLAAADRRRAIVRDRHGYGVALHRVDRYVYSDALEQSRRVAPHRDHIIISRQRSGICVDSNNAITFGLERVHGRPIPNRTPSPSASWARR